MINKYNNTYHSTIKIRPFHIKPKTIFTLVQKKTKNILKLVVMSKYQNIKIFLQKFTLQMALKKCLC